MLYFENVTFFHAELGSDICPRVDNHISGDTLQESTRPLVEKNAINQLSTPWILERVFGGGMPFHTNQFGLGKTHWSLETSLAVVEFPPPYHNCNAQSKEPTQLLQPVVFYRHKIWK